MNPERFYNELVDQTALFADAVHAVDQSAQVPTCPEWTVADLVAHVGIAHRWVSVMVERRVDRPISHGDADERGIPPPPGGRAGRLGGGVTRPAGGVPHRRADTATVTIRLTQPRSTAGAPGLSSGSGSKRLQQRLVPDPMRLRSARARRGARSAARGS